MNFPYKKFPVDPENCPFPDKKSSLRPVIKIGGHEHTCLVGFSYDLEKLAYGILGQDGFFDKWHIKFEYDKENVELKKIA